MVGPSAVAYSGAPVPHALTIEEIGGAVQVFVDAARRSDRAGSTSLRFTPPMAICCTSSSRRCRIAHRRGRVWFQRADPAAARGGRRGPRGVAVARSLPDMAWTWSTCQAADCYPPRSRWLPATRCPSPAACRVGGVKTAAVGMLVAARQAEEILRHGDATWSSSPRRRCGNRTGRCESRTSFGMKWHEAGYPPTYTPAAHGTTRPHWTDPPTIHSSDRRRHRPHVQRESMSSCAASSATLLTTAVGPASARSSAVAAPHVTAMVAMPAARPATTSVTASPT